MMHNHLLIFSWITCVSLNASGAPSTLAEWTKKIKPEMLADLHFIHDVAVVEGFEDDGTPRPLNISQKAKGTDRYLEYLSEADLLASHAVNTPFLNKGKQAIGKNAAMKRIIFDADVSALILAGKDSWSVRTAAEDRTIQRDAPPPKDHQIATLDHWMYELMGYEGVVIDQVGNRLLVLGDSKLFQRKKVQGLLIDKSEPKYFLEKEDKKGLAIIQMVEAQGQHAIFEIVVAENSNKNLKTPRGTKVIIERDQKKSKS